MIICLKRKTEGRRIPKLPWNPEIDLAGPTNILPLSLRTETGIGISIQQPNPYHLPA